MVTIVSNRSSNMLKTLEEKKTIPLKNRKEKTMFSTNEKCDGFISTMGCLITFVDTRLVFVGLQSITISAEQSTNFQLLGRRND